MPSTVSYCIQKVICQFFDTRSVPLAVLPPREIRCRIPPSHLPAARQKPLSPLSFENVTVIFLCKHIHSNFPSRSVAVVTTGIACKMSAARQASSFAPPRCPDSRDITNLPNSSTTSTAGSFFLLCIKGAMLRTAIPAAPMKMILFCSFELFSRPFPAASLYRIWNVFALCEKRNYISFFFQSLF